MSEPLLSNSAATSPRRWFAIAVVIAISMACAGAATGLELYATSQFGPGLSPDSAVYLQGAHELANRREYQRQLPVMTVRDANVAKTYEKITWYPPGYSYFLARQMRSFKLDAPIVARRSSAALLAVCVLVSAAIAWRATRSPLATVAASLLVAAAPDQMKVFAFALSEPLFMPLALAALLCLIEAIARPSRWWLIASAALAAGAGMTRYIGGFLVPLGALLLFLFVNRTWRQRAIDALVFAAISAGPNIAWAIRNGRVGAAAGGRRVEWHPIDWPRVESMFKSMTQWFVAPATDEVRWWIAPTVLGLVLIAAIVFVARGGGWSFVHRSSRTHAGAAAIVLTSFSAAYLVALLAAISTVDAFTPTDYRLLMPMHVPVTLLLVIGGVTLMRSATLPQLRWSIATFLAVAFGFVTWSSASRTWQIARANHETGEYLAYGQKRWHESQALALIDSMPQTFPIWTNAWDVIYLRRGRRMTYAMPREPRTDDPVTQSAYVDAMNDIHEHIRKKQGLVGHFRAVSRTGQATEQELVQLLPGLQRVRVGNEMLILCDVRTWQSIRKMLGMDVPNALKAQRPTPPPTTSASASTSEAATEPGSSNSTSP